MMNDERGVVRSAETNHHCLVKGKRRPTTATECYLGGPSYLPATQDLPVCAFTGLPMTLFVHLHFPARHPYADRSLELFASTTFQKDALDFPEYAGRKVSNKALKKNQAMFQVRLFDANAGALREDYCPPLKQKFLDIVERTEIRGVPSKVGGKPNLAYPDHRPRTILGKPAVFLFQLQSRLRYARVAGGADQVVAGTRRKPVYGDQPFFELFSGSKLFVFGTPDFDPASVYLLCLR